jgi:hypothetical protein
MERSMILEELIVACRNETEKRRRGEPSSDAFGFELFRRAVADRDPRAWDGLLAEYHGLVMSWVLRHPAYVSGQMDARDMVMRAFGRLWVAVGPERLGRFPGLGALLQYLKLCVHSVLLDEVGQRHLACEGQTGLERTVELRDVEALAVDRLSAAELWDLVVGVLNDEAERMVVHLSFVLGMTPGGIRARHPERFTSVADVYRIKRNVLDRLRRSEGLRAFLQPA